MSKIKVRKSRLEHVMEGHWLHDVITRSGRGSKPGKQQKLLNRSRFLHPVFFIGFFLITELRGSTTTTHNNNIQQQHNSARRHLKTLMNLKGLESLRGSSIHLLGFHILNFYGFRFNKKTN